MTTWKEAQAAVLDQLAEARRLIEQKDESATLALINQQDAFCDKAKETRSERLPSVSTESHCHFCQGFVQGGGCLERLDAIDRAVLQGDWQNAGELLDEYSAWVKSLQVA